MIVIMVRDHHTHQGDSGGPLVCEQEGELGSLKQYNHHQNHHHIHDNHQNNTIITKIITKIMIVIKTIIMIKVMIIKIMRIVKKNHDHQR